MAAADKLKWKVEFRVCNTVGNDSTNSTAWSNYKNYRPAASNSANIRLVQNDIWIWAVSSKCHVLLVKIMRDDKATEWYLPTSVIAQVVYLGQAPRGKLSSPL